MDWIAQMTNAPDLALAKIYDDYQADIVKYILVKNSNLDKEDAEDIFQNSLIIFYDNVMTGKLTHLTANIKTYLIAIINNKIIQLNREKQRFANDGLSLISNYIDNEAEEDEVSNASLQKARICLMELGEPCKSLLELAIYQEMKMDEITRILGYKNSDTTKNQKYKCLKRLQKLFFE